MRIAHLNVRSLLPKIEEIRLILEITQLDTFCLTETWLDYTIENEEIQVNNYNVLRNDRNRRGGGVLIYVRDDFEYKERKDLSFNEVESVWIEVQNYENTPVIIGCMYRPPDKGPDYFDNMTDTLEKATSDGKPVILLGDLNVDYLIDESLAQNPVKYLEDLFEMTQMVTEKTRVTLETAKTIDLILSTVPHRHSLTKVQKLGLSDHFLCYTTFGKARKKMEHKYIRYRDFKTFNEEHFNMEIQHSNLLQQVCTSNNLTVSWEMFKDGFLNICDSHAPIKRVRVKNRINPWVTPDIVKMMYNRDYLHKRACKDKNDKLWAEYRATRNNVTRLIKKKKTEYYKNIVAEHRGSPRKFWKELGKLLPNKVNRSSIPKNMSADDLNTYFSNIGKKTIQKVTDNSINHNFLWKGPESIYDFEMTTVNSSDVIKMIKKLPTTTNTDILGMDSKLIKIACEYICPQITWLINLSINTGEVVDDWKVARVTPIYKGKGDRDDPGNYRPISVIGHIGKIMERVIFKQLLEYLTEHDFISRDQSAYLKHHSTQTSLHRVIDEWLDAMNEGQIVAVAFLDIQKCFDSIDHDILLRKLQCYGIRSTEHKWFGSYLSNRRQKVMCGDHVSESSSVETGVPQGSILGPFLFLLFANDLGNFVVDGFCNCYADDTIIFVTGNRVAEVEDKLQICLNGVEEWYIGNKLCVNSSKSMVMIIGTPHRVKSGGGTNLNIKYNGSILEKVELAKYLGVVIDSHLSWDNHVADTCKKVAPKLGLLRRLSSILPKNILLMIYKTYILPLLEYVCTVWGDSSCKNMAKIERMQNWAARIIEKNYDYINVRGSDIAKNLGLPSLKERRDYLKSCLMFKCVNKEAPLYLCDGFTQTHEIASRITRSVNSNKLVVPRPKIDKYKESLVYSGATLWNSLDETVRNSTNIKHFKKNYKEFYMNV